MSDSKTRKFETGDDKARWIEGVLADHRDGIAGADDVKWLRDLLLNDRSARQMYLEANQLSCLLETTSISESESDRLSQQMPEVTSRFNQRAIWGVGLAALLVVGLWVVLAPKFETTVIATLSESHEAVLSGTAMIDDDGYQFGKGRIALSSGLAELEFTNGTRMILDGRSALEIIDGSTVRLDYGKLRVNCPFEARGFEVLAPGGNKIVDLGTEFGIAATPSGDLDLHVFEGFVDLVAAGQDKRTIEAGSAVTVSETREISEHVAKSEMFTTAATLKRKRWEVHRAAMLDRRDVLLYYDFSETGTHPPDIEPNWGQAKANGHIVGASRVAGRIPGKGGLLFEGPDDALVFEFAPPVVFDSLTIAMWIKADRFQHTLSTLLNSNGWHPGDLHFQITKDGNLRSGVNGVGAFQTASGSVGLGEWSFVVVSWKFGEDRARFSCNGVMLDGYKIRSEKPREAKPKLGACQIGAWGDPSAAFFPKTRDFKGRIDEVMIFSRILEEAEIIQIYKHSRP